MCGHTVLHIHSTNDTSKILLIYCKNNDIVELDFLSIKAYNIIFARSHNNLGVDREYPRSGARTSRDHHHNVPVWQQ